MTAVATFGPASLAAQLAELERIRADRDARTDAMDLSSKRATSHEIAHRNNALDGAIKTLATIKAAEGQPGRRELLDLLRASLPLIDIGNDDGVALRRRIHDALDKVRT